MKETFTATIQLVEPRWITVSAPDAPEYLRLLHLAWHQVELPDPKVGDVGLLVYRRTPRSGLWYLTR